MERDAMDEYRGDVCPPALLDGARDAEKPTPPPALNDNPE